MMARKLLNFASMCEGTRLDPNSPITNARPKSTTRCFNECPYTQQATQPDRNESHNSAVPVVD